ncbi:rifamycin-inactivating phosphotransferase [Actinoplanes sp. NPDC049265]|uniref:rifamycin-inactivating phosphotransferase n=1 Tax=Actinoplanes sp. NPDC049265 TaxID=3363902 RepID=UPI003714B4CD
MTEYVLDLTDVGPDQIELAGGKGAHLGELTRIDGVRVPPGFCVTTEAFARVVSPPPGPLDPSRSAGIRQAIRSTVIPGDLASAITARIDERVAYAVRSSATAEDLPTASFAGQHDSYLNVLGPAAVLEHIARCWASLFTERAISYRRHHGIDHRAVRMAVVVQQMADPRASGILFTADPVTANRNVASVDAGYGLGEALVSGLVNPDVYRVRDDTIISRTIAAKRLAVRALPGGGTEEQVIEPDRREQPALTDDQVRRLVRLGRRIEAHFGRPQDIEWCLTGDEFTIVQSRPITTLFPVPPVADDANHVYVSVGHQQMMTDPFKPLGLAFWQMTTPRPMAEAGGRLFVDVSGPMSTVAGRAGLIEALGKSDPLIGDALRTVTEREGFLPAPTEDGPVWVPPGGGETSPIETDPAIVTGLIEDIQAAIVTLRHEIRTRSGTGLFDFIRSDIQQMRGVQFGQRSMQVVMAGMEATWWLNDRLREWLGEKNAADTLSQSVPNNITSEMGLALLDVADAIRPYAPFESLDELPPPAREAVDAFLATYGMRCVGEIDITRTRWAEQPAALVPLIRANIRNFEPGAHRRLFEEGRRQAREKEREVLARLRELPGGEAKAAETKAMIDRVRTFIGYREYPKYHMVSRYFVYKQALTAEVGPLFPEPADAFFLSFDELQEVVRTKHVDEALIRSRRAAFESYRSLTPPRVFTSEGEIITGRYGHDDLPAGALAGLPVSAGTVEGRARVVRDLDAADLSPGDILVTAYTDPSWTPVFVAVAGLITEVGGTMTHGAVIAREYGLPAVVGVEGATTLIRDGQRIRVHGTEGYVEILG